MLEFLKRAGLIVLSPALLLIIILHDLFGAAPKIVSSCVNVLEVCFGTVAMTLKQFPIVMRMMLADDRRREEIRRGYVSSADVVS